MDTFSFSSEPLGDVLVMNNGIAIGTIKRDQSAGSKPVFKVETTFKDVVPRWDPLNNSSVDITISRVVVLGWFKDYNDAYNKLCQNYMIEYKIDNIEM